MLDSVVFIFLLVHLTFMSEMWFQFNLKMEKIQLHATMHWYIGAVT